MSTHALDWAAEGSISSSLILTAQRLIKIETVIAESLPSNMRGAFAAADFHAASLTLVVDHSAMAAKFRQMQSTLSLRLELAGWKVQSIKIKVAAQHRKPQTLTRQKTARALEASDLSHFEKLKTEVRPGPLADAIKRLLQHHQR
jgi:hypothetical protein